MVGRPAPGSRRLWWCLAGVHLLAALLVIQQDALSQVRTGTTDSWIDDHSPKSALIRAAVLPGWGQIYNRQYYKLPFVYGALGGLAYLVTDLNSDYLLYRRAFQFKAFDELTPDGGENPRQDLKPHYDQLVARLGVGELPSSVIRSNRDTIRRNRDLTILATTLVYAFSIFDAFVSAHLLDFDIGEDLSLAAGVGAGGPGARIKLNL